MADVLEWQDRHPFVDLRDADEDGDRTVAFAARQREVERLRRGVRDHVCDADLVARGAELRGDLPIDVLDANAGARGVPSRICDVDRLDYRAAGLGEDEGAVDAALHRTGLL